MDEYTQDLSRRQKAKLKEQHRDMQLAMGHGPTRKLVRRLLDVSGVFDPDSDPGARRIGLWLIAEMNRANPHTFPQLLQEAANEQLGETDAD